MDETGSPGRAKRIVVIDDDVRVRRALRALIESSEALSYAGEASSAVTGLRTAEALCPDAIILDLLLPSAEDGLELLALLVARDLDVIALSIHEVLEGVALAGGAAAFVAKAAGAGVLLDVLLDLPCRDRKVS